MKLISKRHLAWKVSLLGVVGAVATALTVGQAQAATLMARLAERVDLEVLMIITPVTVLLFGIVFEVVRLSLKGQGLVERRRPRRALSWVPGSSEG